MTRGGRAVGSPEGERVKWTWGGRPDVTGSRDGEKEKEKSLGGNRGEAHTVGNQNGLKGEKSLKKSR